MECCDLFLLECNEDDSVTLVPKEDVVFRRPVRKGQAVKFEAPDSSGKRRFFKGVIHAVGSESQYGSLKKLQDQLVKKRKATGLVDSGNPKRRHTLGASLNSSSCGKPSGPLARNHPPRRSPKNNAASHELDINATPKHQSVSKENRPNVDHRGGRNILIDSENEDSDLDPTSSLDFGEGGSATNYKELTSQDSGESACSDLELTPEEKALMEKIKEKRKRFDNKRLSSFGCNKDVLKDCNTTPTRPSTSGSVSTPLNDFTHPQPVGYSTPLGHSQSVRNFTPFPRSKPLVSTIHRSRKPEVPKLFLGTMYRYSCYDECVQELLPDTGVYLNKQEYENIKCSAPSASAMARQLMKAIFSD